MDHVLVVDGVAVQVWRGVDRAIVPEPPAGEIVEAPPGAVAAGMTWDGKRWSVPPRPATPEEIDTAVSRRVSEVAALTGYDDPASFASYVTSTNKTWAAEAKRFVAWRDDVWKVAAAWTADDGTIDDIIADLPEWAP